MLTLPPGTEAYAALLIGWAVMSLVLVLGLGLAAKEGDRKLQEYHEDQGREWL